MLLFVTALLYFSSSARILLREEIMQGIAPLKTGNKTNKPSRFLLSLVIFISNYLVCFIPREAFGGQVTGGLFCVCLFLPFSRFFAVKKK